MCVISLSLSFFNCVRLCPSLGMITFKLCFDWWTPFNQTRDTVFDNERFCKTFKSDGQEISRNVWRFPSSLSIDSF